MSCVTFYINIYLNKNVAKTSFDRILIRSNKNCDHADPNDTNAFTAFFKGDVTNDTVRTKVPDEVSLADSHDVLDYVEDIMDLLMADADNPPYACADVMIPGYPVVALKPNNESKALLIRVLRSWCKRVTA
jgi:hypothetical protein